MTRKGEKEGCAREFLVKRRAPSGGKGGVARSILIAPLPFIKFLRAGQFVVSLDRVGGDSFLASGMSGTELGIIAGKIVDGLSIVSRIIGKEKRMES